jgi:hypothetical protein
MAPETFLQESFLQESLKTLAGPCHPGSEDRCLPDRVTSKTFLQESFSFGLRNPLTEGGHDMPPP